MDYGTPFREGGREGVKNNREKERNTKETKRERRGSIVRNTEKGREHTCTHTQKEGGEERWDG